MSFGPTTGLQVVVAMVLCFFSTNLKSTITTTKSLVNMPRPIIHKTPEAKLAAAREKRSRYYARYVLD